jgi:ABC-type molybdate transport system ATPase subunit
MSKSNAAAKNRRAFPPSQPSPIQTPQPAPIQPNFTLQQVIAVIDKRLINLEAFVKESKDNKAKTVHFEEVVKDTSNDEESGSVLDKIVQEFNMRFEMFAEEISSLKDVVIKLQSYTMDVNKTLMEERINVFSDLGTITELDSVNIDSQENVPESIDVVDENLE